MICTAFLLWNVVKNGSPGKERTYTFSQFLDEVRAGNVTEVTIANGNQVTGKLKNNVTPPLFFSFPVTWFPLAMVTSVTFPARTSSRNCENVYVLSLPGLPFFTTFHSRKAVQIITTQKIAVFTVEFTIPSPLFH